jgi:hypothetical protein
MPETDEPKMRVYRITVLFQTDSELFAEEVFDDVIELTRGYRQEMGVQMETLMPVATKEETISGRV